MDNRVHTQPSANAKDGTTNIVRQAQRARWLVLLWLVALGLWVLWSGHLVEESNGRFGPLLTSAGSALFTVHMALHISLAWISVPAAARRRWYVLYFALQGVLVLLISLAWTPDPFMTVGLYLVLLGEAIVVMRRISVVAAVAMGYLALTGVSVGVTVGFTARFGYYYLIACLIPLIPFAVGYVQAHARDRDQAMLCELEVAHTQLARYAVQIEDLTLLAERQRLARELHDTLAQGLAGVIMQLEVANAHLARDRPGRAHEIVAQAVARARAALAEARGAIDDLRAPLGPDDLPAAVLKDVDDFAAATGIPCTTDLAPLALTPPPLRGQVQRAIAEGLANVARHARAHHVWVRAAETGAMLEVEVGDDGIGFDPATVGVSAGHYGLLGVRERAHLAGGELQLHSAPGRGTTLRLRLPLDGGEGGA